MSKEQNPFLTYARLCDHNDRELFCKIVNEFNTNKTSGQHFSIFFADNSEPEDTLVLDYHNDTYVIINTHMNSIDATAYCLASFVHSGECAGLCNSDRKYVSRNELPDFVKAKLPPV